MRAPSMSVFLLQTLSAQEVARDVGRRAPVDLDLRVHPLHRAAR